MSYQIDKINKEEYPEVVEVWEASVRATHHFLQEEDITYFKPLILEQYLDAVELRCVRDDNKQIIGFLGVADTSLEMLFIHPKYFGKGIGTELLKYAIESFKVDKVDVNEQNEGAHQFYVHHGFEVISRSELDPTGKPYPILHMQLNRL